MLEQAALKRGGEVERWRGGGVERAAGKPKPIRETENNLNLLKSLHATSCSLVLAISNSFKLWDGGRRVLELRDGPVKTEQ